MVDHPVRLNRKACTVNNLPGAVACERLACVSLSLLWAPYDGWAQGEGEQPQQRKPFLGPHASLSHTRSKAAPDVPRDKPGRIAHSAVAKDQFKWQQLFLSTGKSKGACPGYVIDPVVPLKRGGKVASENKQWQMKEVAKVKDRTESPGGTGTLPRG